MHALGNEADADAEAYALHLDDVRKGLLPAFQTGEAIVAVRGESEPWKIKVHDTHPEPPRNVACLFCNHKRFCSYDEVASVLGATNSRLSLAMAEILSNPYDRTSVQKQIRSICMSYGLHQSDETCVLGYMLEKYAEGCGDREKRRILFQISEV